MAGPVYSDDLLKRVLNETKTIALIGASANSSRPSYGVMQYMLHQGYRIFPVNPGLAGQELLGCRVYARLADVPELIDMVDIFRNSEDAGGVVDEALALERMPKVIWMQIGVINEAAAARAEAQGVTVIMDHCPKIEHARLID